MKELTVVVTASGCPGASTFIRMLKNNGERRIKIIATDMDKEAIGRFVSDKFYQTPSANSSDYIPKMLEITEKERPDILFPESSMQVYPLAKNKRRFEELGTKVVVSNPEAISLSNNKWEMYRTLEKNTDLILPEHIWPKTLDDFVDAAKQLGYPNSPICFKPHMGKGSRGFRIIDKKANRRNLLLNKKPNSRYISMEEFVEIFSNSDEPFPNFIVQKFYSGMEYTADSISLNGETLLTTIKSVEQARWGVIARGELKQKPELVEQTKKILKAIPLDYCSNIQFIGDKLIEINPRVSSFIYQDDLIPPYLAIKLALGEITTDEVRQYSNRIAYGRRMIRYMDQVFFGGKTYVR